MTLRGGSPALSVTMTLIFPKIVWTCSLSYTTFRLCISSLGWGREILVDEVGGKGNVQLQTWGSWIGRVRKAHFMKITIIISGSADKTSKLVQAMEHIIC